MLVIGLIGGVASGKSAAAAAFHELGAAIISGDALGHEVLREPEVIAAVAARWGPGVLDPDAAEPTIDRRQVAKIVFAEDPTGPRELAWLEQLTHPRIAERIHRNLESLRKPGGPPAVVLDAALLLRGGWRTYCDQVVFIDAPWSLRVERARGRGWSEADLAAREARQEPLAVKRAAADAVLENAGSRQDLRRSVEQFWRKHELPLPPAAAYSG